MDGSFACPECGSTVEVRGLAPGRQVRCGFCHRLVEVPFLPRVPSSRWRWKRRRFLGWKLARWAWIGVAVVAVAAVLVTGFRMARRQYRSAQEETIGRMLASSRKHEANGQLDQALVELDAALNLIRQSGASADDLVERERAHRVELARREAKAALDRLVDADPDPFPTGDWLNLIARTEEDPDLKPMSAPVKKAFQAAVRRRIEDELTLARRESDAGHADAALRACDRIAGLLPRLDPEDEPGLRTATAGLVGTLVRSRGVVIETRVDHLVAGSEASYRDELIPLLADGLESNGYLPNRASSPWKSAWKDAAYRLVMALSENREGNYLSSENRLTRIQGHLILSNARGMVWETTPTARSTAPLPGLPAYYSSRLALNRSRSAELERLLYENARGQIRGRFAQALGHMPSCCP